MIAAAIIALCVAGLSLLYALHLDAERTRAELRCIQYSLAARRVATQYRALDVTLHAAIEGTIETELWANRRVAEAAARVAAYAARELERSSARCPGLIAFADGALTDAEAAVFREHLRNCARCRYDADVSARRCARLALRGGGS